jgi:hypothetical protein
MFCLGVDVLPLETYASVTVVMARPAGEGEDPDPDRFLAGQIPSIAVKLSDVD